MLDSFRVWCYGLAYLTLLSLQSSAFGQIQHVAESRWIVSGLRGVESVNDNLVLADKSSKPKLIEVGFVEIQTDAAIVRLRAEDSQRNPLETLAIAEHKFLILGSGKLYIAVTCVDFESQVFDQSEFVITVGTQPDDKPEPPKPVDVPEDVFGNIGQRVAEWAAGESGRKDVAAAYRHVAKALRTDPSITQTDAGKMLAERVNKVSGYRSGYVALRDGIRADFTARWPLDRGTHADYLDAIAVGLEAGQ